MKDIDIDALINLEEKKSDSSASVREIFGLFIKHWIWFLLGVILAMTAAFLFLRYTVPVYNVTSTIKLKDVKSAQNNVGMGVFNELSMIGAVDNVRDETHVMRSTSTVLSVINQLKLHTSYIVEGRIKSLDLYTGSPVIVDMEQSDLDNLTQNIYFDLQYNSENSVHVNGIFGGTSVDTTFTSLPALLNTPFGNISFTYREGRRYDQRLLHIIIQQPDDIINTYRNNLTIAPVESSGSSVLNLSVKTPYPQKGVDFLSTLVDVYNNEMIEEKNMEALNTQKFINERIRFRVK
ncbi:MAG TPA: Wzz/FepE/Etk N-terminal domain-containing protein [Petrimonas sp.]|nr:Wzz/FepE/Etk N-terminal domain-containing protein [Petrimonas sp.]